MSADGSARSTRVVIADDHALVRKAVRMLLERAGMNVVGEATDGEEAVALVEGLAPDAAVLDVAMPTLDGVAALRRLREQMIRVPVVMLSAYKQGSFARRSMDAGASGYVFKGDAARELVRAIRLALQDRLFLSRALREAGVEAHGDEAPEADREEEGEQGRAGARGEP